MPGQARPRPGPPFATPLAATPTHVEIQNEDVIEIGDIETDGGNFTDGCGKIGTDLAKRIMKESQLQLDKDEYIPSVFQICYQGCIS